MALWGSIDQANNAPKYDIGGAYGAANSNGVQLFANTTIGVRVANVAFGVFGANTEEVSNSTIGGDLDYAPHSGWNLRIAGTGPVATIAVANTGAGYNVGGGAANGYIVFSGGSGSGANAQWFSNATGHITSVSLLSGGGNYNVAPTAAINNTNTAIATFTVTVGGRSGRVAYETLVAMGSMS
jgi:hypothetical protein